jgi:hypothetical protein
MATVTDELPLSGVTLPLILRRKLQEQKKASKGATENRDDDKDAGRDKDVADDTVAGMNATTNRIFAAEDLEERIRRAKSAMEDIQKQLQRGEESYYEETSGHGNLYRGWDAFIDAKDVGSGTSAPQSVGMSSRRMPPDCRWFSGSCGSIGRLTRPAPLSTKNLSATEKVSSVRSEANTPIPTPSSVGEYQGETVKSESVGGQDVAEANTESLPKEGSDPQQPMADNNASAVPESTESAKSEEGEKIGTGESAMPEDAEWMDTGEPSAATPSTEAVQIKADSARRPRKRKSSE